MQIAVAIWQNSVRFVFVALQNAQIGGQGKS
jgi:hypothetical protein